MKFGATRKMAQSRGDTYFTDNSDHFVRFVDDDLYEFAADTQRSANGNMKVIDVHAGHTFQGAAQLDEWIAQSRFAKLVGPHVRKR